MKSRILTLTTLSALLVGAADLQAQAVVGAPAPEFTLSDTQGAAHRLADFAGKPVVPSLETGPLWHPDNPSASAATATVESAADRAITLRNTGMGLPPQS